jgi:hypothetical protein
MVRSVFLWFLAALGGLGATVALAQKQQDQSADPDYDTKVAAPAYTSRHPAVLFDEAHHNLHTSGGLYKPFADLIGHDGYRVEPNKKPISRALLDRYEILIIANATGAEGDGPDAAEPALRETECKVVDAWVKSGGALLLITDMKHWGAASQRLGSRFGVEMSGGVTVDPRNSVPGMPPTQLLFSRENGLLGDHPIVRGRDSTEQVNRVVTYAGQSLRGPRGSAPFLLLGETAMDRYPGDPVSVRAAGRCQGLALAHGKGRVVVLGEAGCLSAQFGAAGQPFGMNDPGNDNRRLALNIMHWLSGLTPADPRAASGRPGAPPPAPRPGP